MLLVILFDNSPLSILRRDWYQLALFLGKIINGLVFFSVFLADSETYNASADWAFWNDEFLRPLFGVPCSLGSDVIFPRFQTD